MPTDRSSTISTCCGTACSRDSTRSWHSADGPMEVSWYDDDRVRHVLDEGELLHVAVAARGGPRITPTVFSVERRQLWFVVTRGSVKARAIARFPHVGGLIRGGDQALMLSGRA